MFHDQSKWANLFLLAAAVLSASSTASGQIQRYQPNTPTISPYLRLFENRLDNPALPNYHLFVRPLQEQQRVNQLQKRALRQQAQSIDLLQAEVQGLEGRQAEGPLVAPTGHSGWFFRPAGNAGYLNTSRFYSQSGTGARR